MLSRSFELFTIPDTDNLNRRRREHLFSRTAKQIKPILIYINRLSDYLETLLLNARKALEISLVDWVVSSSDLDKTALELA